MLAHALYAPRRMGRSGLANELTLRGVRVSPGRVTEVVLILTHFVHSFRRKPSTDTDTCRPPIPMEWTPPSRRHRDVSGWY